MTCSYRSPKSEFKNDFDACAKLAGPNAPLSLLIIDVDRYQYVNMECGHVVGDAVLVEVASTIKAACRGKGRCSRWAGGALAVLLPNVDMNEAVALAEQLRQKISQLRVENCTEPVTVSIGVASCPGTNDTFDHLVRDAEEAMYAAKAEGRNRVSIAAGQQTLR